MLNLIHGHYIFLDIANFSNHKWWFEKFAEENGDLVSVYNTINAYATKFPDKPPPLETMIKPKALEKLGTWRLLCQRARSKLWFLEDQMDKMISDYTKALVAEFHYGNNYLKKKAWIPLRVL